MVLIKVSQQEYVTNWSTQEAYSVYFFLFGHQEHFERKTQETSVEV